MAARLIALFWFAWASLPALAQQPITAELRIRDTSFYAGNTFHFYIRVNGVDQAGEPKLKPADPALRIRYVGAATSSSRGEAAYTFTYEALPLQAGSLTIPGSELTVQGQALTTPPQEVTVAWPATTSAMQLKLDLSHKECFVGEPVTLRVSWITALSLNGIKAVDLRIPALTDSHFHIKPPLHAVDPGEPTAIGLPVANLRIIASYRETTLGDAPAAELSFEQVLIPVQPSSVNLLLPPATLLCSYSEPARAKFQGTRYPSYFNNDFFDQDVTGAFQRLFVQAPPVTLRIKALPQEGRPSSFTGIVGPFSAMASAEPLSTPALSPVNFKVRVEGYAFPQVLELPPWKLHHALDHAFLLPESSTPERGRLQPDGAAEFTVPIRPRTESAAAIPSLEFAYFDPKKESYAVVRTAEIPITVTSSASATVNDLEFADGMKLRNEVEPIPGGLTENRLGQELLISQSPHTWTLEPWPWLFAFLLPPLGYFLLRRGTRSYRKARTDPELARRLAAFRRFRKALHRLPPEAPPFAVNQLLRAYFRDRFDLFSPAGEHPDLVSIARKLGIEADTAELLANVISQTDVHTFARQRPQPEPVEKRRLLALVRQFETSAACLLLGLSALFGTPVCARAASPEETLHEACALFDQANAKALVNPAQAQGLYRLAAARFESLAKDHQIRNGALYYNLGNTYLLADDLGRATVNYLRAREYIPSDRQLAEALRTARLRQVDDFPQEAPTRMKRGLLFWHYYLGPSARLAIVAASFTAIWAVLALNLFFPLAWRWKAWTTLSAIIILAGGSSVIHARSDPRQAAVIVQPEVLPRKGDAQIYDPAFTNPLHSGSEVTILETRRDWLRIRVRDGSQGWVPASAVERVVP